MLRLLVAVMLLGGIAQAQWVMQDSGTTASLRGVHYVGEGVVWASGTGGTVLRTVDMGKSWQKCAVPPGAEKLDFRGLQAFDAKTALVMSSGKGDLSRLYKTTDGCATWTLMATNPEKDGFWDSVRSPLPEFTEESPASSALVLGDAVNGRTQIWEWKEGWGERELELTKLAPLRTDGKEGSFAASNSVLQTALGAQTDKTWKFEFWWASNASGKSYISFHRVESTAACEPCRAESGQVALPVFANGSSSGVFSFGFRSQKAGVAVGGDYQHENFRDHVAAWSSDAGLTWKAAKTDPGGYRSAVAYSEKLKTWITVGPNGTDASFDDGRNWQALEPGLKDVEGADRGWNALSLPFVVGAKGRIGLLREATVTSARKGYEMEKADRAKAKKKK
ncbi:MAG: hypothetical protein PW792_11630 [Acidobacteriaceae bacterium]|nr:hypothetical protein [Acidobacteriaceae bacterium]